MITKTLNDLHAVVRGKEDETAILFSGKSASVVRLCQMIKVYPRVLFLNTGFHYPETVAFYEHCAEYYHQFEWVELTPGPLAQNLYDNGANKCCDSRKRDPLIKARAELGITTLLSGAHGGRKAGDHGVYSPISDWDHTYCRAFQISQNIPMNPLTDDYGCDFTCQPCSLREPDGTVVRWKNSQKTECSLGHVGGGK